VERGELAKLDRSGVVFKRLDSSGTGHVSIEAFAGFFGDLISLYEPKEKGHEECRKLLGLVEDGLTKLVVEREEEASEQEEDATTPKAGEEAAAAAAGKGGRGAVEVGKKETLGLAPKKAENHEAWSKDAEEWIGTAREDLLPYVGV